MRATRDQIRAVEFSWTFLPMVRLLNGAEKTGDLCVCTRSGLMPALKPSAQAGDELNFVRISAGFAHVVCRAVELARPNNADVRRELPSQLVPKTQADL